MIIIGILLVLVYFGLAVLVLFRSIVQNKLDYLLYYIVGLLPFYQTLQILVFNATELVILVRLIQYSKELVILASVGYWLVSHKNIFHLKWKLTSLDWAFLLFFGLSGIYLAIGWGEAGFVNQAVYFKNILLTCLMYFLGRNCFFQFKTWNQAFSIVFTISLIAFFVVTLEYISGTHFHSLIGYGHFNLAINDIEPVGNYGLTWTFEAQDGQKRFGSVFSNPLEFSASMLISFSASIIFILSSPYRSNRVKYLAFLVITFICVSLAFSRASFVAFFGMIFFMAVMLKYYRLLLVGFSTALVLGIYLYFAAPTEIRYFVIDTIMFENSSSLTHLIEWIEGLESMRQNPLGTGLATSGNAGGVDADLQVGGENQFLIFGVQLGWFGLATYICMIFLAIRNSWRTFRFSNIRQDQIVPFIAASTKFGLLLPLFTANAESYLYVSFFSWWMVGHSITVGENRKRLIEN